MVCKACGKEIARGQGYKVTPSKRYCSEKCYREYEKMWGMVFQFIDDCPMLRKECKTWGNNFEKINCYLYDNADRISTALNKDFKSLYSKIRYFSVMVQNGLAEYKMPSPVIIKKTDNEYYEHKYKPKARRKCLADYERSIDDE